VNPGLGFDSGRAEFAAKILAILRLSRDSIGHDGDDRS